jgi:hypothetical protein
MQIFSLEVCFCMFKIGVHLSFEILFLQNLFQLWPPRFSNVALQSDVMGADLE